VTASALFAVPVSGPAYGRTFRAIATLAVLVLLVYGARVVFFLLPEPPSRDGWIFIGAAAFALVATWYFVVMAHTTIDAQGIRQTGLIDRKTQWNEIWHARVGGLPFSRRLIVRTTGGRLRSYFGSTPELLAAFAQIAAKYPRRR
jgi:hypothetical protein